MQLKIGNVVLKNNIILGPMAGITDLPFRILCHEMGAGLCVSEMISAKGITFRNRNTEDMLLVDEKERPTAIQLFGNDPEVCGQVAGELNGRNFDILDFNMGCPVLKVVKNHEGSALMNDPAHAGDILKAMVKASDKPVTVKIRKGFDEEHVNAVECAKYLEDAGVSAIAVHGRTREQFYSGTADWDIIAKVKEAVSIPVIGNGDVDSPEKALSLIKHTGCDGVMIGRGAQGNPWIFKRVEAFLENGEILPEPGFEEIISMVLKHAGMMVELKGELIAMRQMRSHVMWYLKGVPFAAKMRKMAGQIKTYEDLEKLMTFFAAELSV